MVGWEGVVWSEKHISLLQPANLKEFAVGGIILEERVVGYVGSRVLLITLLQPLRVLSSDAANLAHQT